MAQFAAVFIDVEEEKQEVPLYSCACKKKFPNLFDLILHESKMHFIEFSRIATKLKSLIDEFIVPDEKFEPKVFKKESSPEYFDSTPFECLDDDSLDRVKDEQNAEELEIIRRLQESGQVSFKVKIEEDVPRKLKRDVKPLKKIETVSFRKIVRRQAPSVRPVKQGRRPANAYRCANCPMIFEKHSLMREHQKQHKFICDYCGQSYTMKLNLKMHILRHQGIKTFCVECGIQTANLEEHVKKHEKDAMLVCDICGKEIRGKQRMNNHMNRGHKSRNARFFCKYCDAGFRYMADLNDHAIKHEPDRREHKCPVCDKAFRRRPEMRRHMQVHTGRKWRCEDCGREYAWQRGLMTHKKTSCTANNRAFE